ncbi:Hypothetical predicted protein [Pelobates cultripes]|uniref:Uncharacterized protein n=1 Tax=Pelobates cultripes TaxID=61616 RepID=A0AAD1S7R5_PELCU|nr:Hypothetical predicted protein [Pelobates cultripes]
MAATPSPVPTARTLLTSGKRSHTTHHTERLQSNSSEMCQTPHGNINEQFPWILQYIAAQYRLSTSPEGGGLVCADSAGLKLPQPWLPEGLVHMPQERAGGEDQAAQLTDK